MRYQDPTGWPHAVRTTAVNALHLFWLLPPELRSFLTVLLLSTRAL